MKRKSFYSVLFYLLWGLSVVGQISINPVFQGNDAFFIEQIYQVVLLNTSNSNAEGILHVAIEKNSGENVFTNRTNVIRIESGALINPSQLFWSFGNFASNIEGQTLNSTGRLLGDQYIICYKFIQTNQSKDYGNYCEEYNIKPFGPIELIYPPNYGVIEEVNPLFTWKPPIIGSLSGVTYYIKLVEQNDNQGINQALFSNPPLLEERNVNPNFINYPITSIPLVKGEHYVWQVEAFLADKSLGKSEIWTFVLGENEKELPKSNQEESFRLPKVFRDGSYYLVNEKVYIAYDNKYNEPLLNYKLFLNGSNKSEFSDLPRIELKPGLNQITISLKDLAPEPNNKYSIEISNKKGQKFFTLILNIKELDSLNN
ncbi:MAG: hypothetical protein R2879_20770 [Saprospiraceae bacterium]